jgi:hypothetical protein
MDKGRVMGIEENVKVEGGKGFKSRIARAKKRNNR